jgi:hypothetical protein
MKKTNIKTMIGLGIFAMTLVFAGSASTTYAATYAYVNTAGEVRMVEASTPNVAISTAVGRSLHSGVMLLSNALDFGIVGDQVIGPTF